MCGSQFDYCMPAYTERGEDYRGCDPLYRAGSIFNSDKDYSGYFNDPDCVDCNSGKTENAGHFGETRPLDERGFPVKSRHSKSPTKLGIPPQTPNGNGNGMNYDVPTIEQLIEGTPMQETIPLAPPPSQPIMEPQIIESMPFTTQIGVPRITAEELRRLDSDPNVTEVKILNIDDSLNTALPLDSSPK